MPNYFKKNFDSNNIIPFIDELPLWSAPFGLKLLDIIKMRKGMNVLDIGSGLGFPAIEIAMRLGDTSKVWGIEPWTEARERANEKIKALALQNIEIIDRVAEGLPFEADYFDLIVSNNGINNVQDITKTFKECHRTAKTGCQFVFTMNLDGSMHEFYSVYFDVLKKHDMKDETEKLNKHIYDKRKPIVEMEKWLTESGFFINNIITDSFKLRYIDATTMFNHFLIQIGFIESWLKVVPENKVNELFNELEENLNRNADEFGELVMTIPYSIFDCFKV